MLSTKSSVMQMYCIDLMRDEAQFGEGELQWIPHHLRWYSPHRLEHSWHWIGIALRWNKAGTSKQASNLSFFCFSANTKTSAVGMISGTHHGLHPGRSQQGQIAQIMPHTHTHDRAHWQYAILVATLLWQRRVHYLESTRVGHPTCTNSTTIPQLLQQ